MKLPIVSQRICEKIVVSPYEGFPYEEKTSFCARYHTERRYMNILKYDKIYNLQWKQRAWSWTTIGK